MNKIRINPRSNDPHKNIDLDRSKTSSNVPTKGINEEIQYFLDKNENEFKKEDIIRFQKVNEEYTDAFLDTSKRIISKLFKISKILIEESNAVKESTIEKADFHTVSSLPNNFKELESLINEIVEDNQEGSTSFITTLMDSLVIIDKELNSDSLRIENLYEILSDMLQKLQVYDITQQKYIYKSIANGINHCIPNYTFLSPENGNFVDPKFHKIVSGSGQRITRGLSYILLDSTNDEVLKFGQVKTI